MNFLYYTPAAFLALVLIRKYQEYKWGYCKNQNNLKGKIAVITGANSGIGFEVANEFAKRGAKIILACRDISTASRVAQKINSKLGKSADLVPMQLDLASLQSIKSFSEELSKQVPKIDILVNNAGVSYPKREYVTTKNGLEIHFGVNHLGHFYLTNLLLPKLKVATPSRVIIVSSSLHQRGNIYLDDLNGSNKIGKTPPYNNSKLANAYFARELAERVKNFKINTYAVCPGWVYTKLFRHYIKWYHYVLVAPMAFLFMRSARQGAQTIIHCATEPALDGETGQLYRNCAPFKSSVEFEKNVAEQLWTASENLIDSKMKLL